jgi:plasmid stabilization system protein ParE
MTVIYHPLVKRDVLEILDYYQKVSVELADEFHNELQAAIEEAAENPLRFLKSLLLHSVK